MGVVTIAISVDSEDDAKRAKNELNLGYTVLFDSETKTTRAFGIFDLLNDKVSAPATYLFDKSGELFAYHIGDNIRDRPSTREVLTAFRLMSNTE